MTNNPVTILVIGNGFDLSLKLPTSYGDFLKFADYMRYYSSEGHTYDVEKNRSFQVDKRIGQLIDQYSGKVADNLSSRRAEIGEACQNNFWIEYFIKKQTELNSKGRNRWVDFETEITRIIAVLENDLLNSEEGYEGELNTYNNEEIDEFFDEHEEIRHDTFSDIHDRLLTDLNKLTWLLGFYLCLFVENIKDVAQEINSVSDRILNINTSNTSPAPTKGKERTTVASNSIGQIKRTGPEPVLNHEGSGGILPSSKYGKQQFGAEGLRFSSNKRAGIALHSPSSSHLIRVGVRRRFDMSPTLCFQI